MTSQFHDVTNEYNDSIKYLSDCAWMELKSFWNVRIGARTRLYFFIFKDFTVYVWQCWYHRLSRWNCFNEILFPHILEEQKSRMSIDLWILFPHILGNLECQLKSTKRQLFKSVLYYILLCVQCALEKVCTTSHVIYNFTFPYSNTSARKNTQVPVLFERKAIDCSHNMYNNCIIGLFTRERGSMNVIGN